MPEINVKHIDAFTSAPFGGNPAGVVVRADGLSEAQMQLVAREKNLSETAFVLSPGSADADLRIRWFTPASEVDLCGHATIAAFHALAQEGMYGMQAAGSYRFRLETRSGVLGVSVAKTGAGADIEFQLPVPQFRAQSHLSADILGSMGLRMRDLSTDGPIVEAQYLYVPVRSLDVLRGLRPDFSALGVHCEQFSWVGVCVFSLETVDPGSAVHSRFYAPAVGIDEDPVTGSANGPLGAYLVKHILPAGRDVPSKRLADGRTEFIGEQGDLVGRKGRVAIRIAHEGAAVSGVWIAGRAVTLMDATMTFGETAP